MLRGWQLRAAHGILRFDQVDTWIANLNMDPGWFNKVAMQTSLPLSGLNYTRLPQGTAITPPDDELLLWNWTGIYASFKHKELHNPAMDLVSSTRIIAAPFWLLCALAGVMPTFWVVRLLLAKTRRNSAGFRVILRNDPNSVIQTTLATK